MIVDQNRLYGRAGAGKLRRFRGFAGYGRSAYGGFGWDAGQQQSWCQQNFPSPDLNAKCMDNGFPKSLTPPWTDAGAAMRGIRGVVDSLAHTISDITGPGTSSGPPPSTGGGSPKTGPKGGAASSAKMFGIPKTVLYVGGGVLALGVLAYGLKARRR